MQIFNITNYQIESLFECAIAGLDCNGLIVEVKYSPAGSRRSVSGTYYRLAPAAPDGRLIRIRINRTNRYPISIPFKTSNYFTKKDRQGREIIYQRFRNESFDSPEHLLTAIFLHEISHFLDNIQGRNGRYKQTKADRFAVERLTLLGIVSDSIDDCK